MEENILEEASQEAESAENSRALYEVKMKYLGRTGKISLLLKKMKEIAQEERPAFGKKINDLREKLEAHFEKLEEKIKQKELEHKLKNERIDVTMPGKRKKEGVLHPVTRVKNELID
ncbi:MAG: phenylalanine--tRNA ligase subunit alpha, partial [Clostridia bacterium]|nr:phenylalanine--tRNA ligase subunit alpha [Clostridia bacterium]